MEEKETSYIIQFKGDDMSSSPSRWTSRGIDASQEAFFWWGYILLPGRNPILVLRCFGNEQSGVTGSMQHFECADGMFVRPKELYSNPVSDCDEVNGWHLSEKDLYNFGNSDDLVYEASVCSDDEKKVIYRAGTRQCEIKEGNFLNITGENMDYAMCIDPPGVFGPYFTWSCVYHGTYYGQDVIFLGGADRFFSKEQTEKLNDKNAYYWGNIISGMDRDGKKEYGCFYMYNGKTFAYYVREGTIPKWSENVEYEADWAVDPSDPECIAPRSMIWKFDDIEIHWKAEYTAVYGTGGNINHFGHWYEKNGSRDFTCYLGAFESNIRPEHIRNFQR